MGLVPGAVPTTVLPRGRSLGTHGTAPRVSGPRPGREPGGPALGRRGLTGARRGPGARGASLPGQCSFPRARRGLAGGRGVSGAVAARRWPTRGRRGWRPRRRRLLLPEAQPPKGFKKTLLHGVGLAARAQRSLSWKSRSWPKLLFLWLSGHVIDGGAGARRPALLPSTRPNRAGQEGVVPTWKARDAGRLTSRKTSATDLHSPPPPTLTSSPARGSLRLSPWAHRTGTLAHFPGCPRGRQASAKALPHPTAH